MKYEVKFTTQFKKDLKRAKKQHKDLDKLFEAVEMIANSGRKMTKTQFDRMMANGLEQAKADDSYDFNKAFNELEAGLEG